MPRGFVATVALAGPKPKQRSGIGAAAACLRGCLAVDPLSQGAGEVR